MTFSLAAYWRNLASGLNRGFFDRLLLMFLIPLSLPYALVQRLRSWLYQSEILTPKRLPRPVVSIGNITVGGTGKTPVTAYIARLLLSQGLKVAVLSRGYGGRLEGQTALVSNGKDILLGAEECGDEPFLLARTVPGLMVVIGIDRYAAGQLAMEHLSPDIFLLDDGFQHLRLHRDLNILLLDCTRPFGNGWTLPAGMLREPTIATRRAGLAILTRCTEECPTAASPVAGKPFCRARHSLMDATPLAGGEPISFGTLKDAKVLAFAGIAEPQAFFQGLRSLGLNVIETISLPDHAVYDESLVAKLFQAIQTSAAEWAVTTEKDGVKLRRLPPKIADKTLLARLDISIEDPAPLTALLRNLLQK